MNLIDLSMPLGPSTPVYPGDPAIELSESSSLDGDGFRDSMLTFDVHAGTHVDAPAHMVADGRTLGHYEPSRFAGRGVLVDARERLTAAALKLANVWRDDIVLVWTGMSDAYQASGYFERVPAIDPDAVAYLKAVHPKMVAVDAGSIDSEPFEIHKALLRADILIAENLVGLSALEGLEFEVLALPVKLDADGAPARVIARVTS